MTSPAGRRPGIRDVAQAAGVSVTTVSDAMSGKGRVDAQTRAMVLQVADELGYRPRRSAQALRSGRTGTIALCLPRRPERSGTWMMSVDYYMELALACAAVAMDRELHLLLTPRPQDARDVAGLQVDGVIVVDPPEGDVALRQVRDAGVPYVTVDRDLAAPDNWWVAGDNGGNIVTLLDHLAERGAARIAMLSSDERWAWFEDSTTAYRQWCEQHGQQPLLYMIDLDQPQSGAAAATARILAEDPAPDAIVAMPNGGALGVVRAAHELGLELPGQLLVASAVDGNAHETSHPTITSLDLRPTAVAEAAVELLLRRIGGAEPDGPVIINGELRIRESTSP